MALKGDRDVLQTSHLYRIQTGVDAERGTILVASGTNGVLNKGVLPGDVPIGLLLDDVENLDYTTRPQILVRNVVPRGSEVSVLRKGTIKTNLIAAGVNPAVGEPALLAPSGWQSNAGGGAAIGTWLSTKDADGYAYLSVNL